MEITTVKPGSFADAGVDVRPADSYQVRRVALQGAANRNNGRAGVQVLADGDTLQLLEVIGADAIAVATQIRGRRYPYIPMQEGSRITRNFDRYFVRFLGDSAGTTANNEWVGTFLSSWGVAYEPPREKVVGIQGAPGIARGIASATGVDLFRNAFQTNTARYPFASTSDLPAFCKRGGTLKIANMGAVTLWIYFGPPGSFAPGGDATNIPSENSAWPILPSSSEEWRVESLLSLFTHYPINTSQRPTLCAATSGGTCEYRVMASSMFVDGSEIECGPTYASELS